ncbi:replication protein a 70 kda DNA-binding subunit a [Anaeramoeba flamelloides]|uniref:Replication protein a 70 kDa DNA-binding subunit a n=1 Tax=Anaeramoeba flamelloides TaxID=1746091 RepID=A0ABQ8XSJ9_9EUKA|nr:replication protein a 70 kda DNA-binding subunit a [Anaeramoeba flamelloides]
MTTNPLKGVLLKIANSQLIKDPLLQIITIPQNDTNHPHLLISDGIFFATGVLSQQLKSLLGNTLNLFTVIKLKNWFCKKQEKSDEKLILISDLEIVSQHNEKIGDPVSLTKQLQQQQQQQQKHELEQQQQQQQQQPQKQNTFPKIENKSPFKQEGDLLVSVENRNPFYQNSRKIFSTNQKVNLISGLSENMDNLTLRVRITNISEIIEYRSGEGRILNVDLIDEEGSEIRLTFFNELIDRHQPQLVVGKAYFVTNCQIKRSNPKFSSFECNYILTCRRESQICPCDDKGLPYHNLKFIPISAIQQIPDHNFVTIIGVVSKVGTLDVVTTQRAEKQHRLNILLVDISKVKIECTCWGKIAKSLSLESQPVLILRGVKVYSYNGVKKLTIVNSTQIIKNPDIKQAYKLKGWWNNLLKEKEKNNLNNLSSSKKNSHNNLTNNKNANRNLNLIDMKSKKEHPKDQNNTEPIFQYKEQLQPNEHVQQTKHHEIKGNDLQEKSQTGEMPSNNITFSRAINSDWITQAKSPLITVLQQNIDQLDNRVLNNTIIVRGTIMKMIKQNKLYYECCPSKNCIKKVIPKVKGWYCPKCRLMYKKCNYKYLFRVILSDHTASFPVTIFHSVATSMLKYKVSQIIELEKLSQYDKIDDLTNNLFPKFGLWLLKISKNDWNGKPRKQALLQSFHILENFKQDSSSLISEINQYKNLLK